MLENCKRLICSPSLNKVYCIVLYYIHVLDGTSQQPGGGGKHLELLAMEAHCNKYIILN